MASSHLEDWTRLAAGAVRRALGPLRRPYGALRYRLSRLVFDRGNVDTSDHATLAELNVDAPGRQDYAPSGWRFGRRMLRHYCIGTDDVFCDFGSGMGRVVIMVARGWRFRCVMGVEISKELDRVARENVRRNHRRFKSRQVELVCSDVLDFEIPDSLTFAYFYNPFEGEIFEQVIERLIASLDRSPRRLVLLYANPRMHDVVISSGRFAHVRSSLGLRPDIKNYRIHTYESV